MSLILVSGSSVGLVAGNVMVAPVGHGIEVAGSSDVTIRSNVVDEPGQGTTNTFDGIILSGDSNVNAVVGNTVKPSGVGNTTRYGVNVSAATCDDNVVADNWLGPIATYGTGSFNNAGTGTITAPAANGQYEY
jgi:hypothetical protein